MTFPPDESLAAFTPAQRDSAAGVHLSHTPAVQS